MFHCFFQILLTILSNLIPIIILIQTAKEHCLISLKLSLLNCYIVLENDHSNSGSAFNKHLHWTNLWNPIHSLLIIMLFLYFTIKISIKYYQLSHSIAVSIIQRNFQMDFSITKTVPRFLSSNSLPSYYFHLWYYQIHQSPSYPRHVSHGV